MDPFVLSRARVTSKAGRTIYGEFITLPWTAAQMAAMPRQEAAAGVRAALELARSRGAQLVGLGAFTSVVTRGGLDVSREGVAVTTGNSYTAVASAQAVAMAMKSLGEGFGPHLGAAIVGGTGAIGRAMALLLAEDVGRLILIGNPDRAVEVSRRRLLAVAGDVCRHLAVRYHEGQRFAHGSLGSRLLAAYGGCPDPDAPADLFAGLAECLESTGTLPADERARRRAPPRRRRRRRHERHRHPDRPRSAPSRRGGLRPLPAGERQRRGRRGAARRPGDRRRGSSTSPASPTSDHSDSGAAWPTPAWPRR